jgi:hypothetical protein
MESLGNNHGFVDGNKRIAFNAADVFLGATVFTSRSKGWGSVISGDAKVGQPAPNLRVDTGTRQADGLISDAVIGVPSRGSDRIRVA